MERSTLWGVIDLEIPASRLVFLVRRLQENTIDADAAFAEVFGLTKALANAAKAVAVWRSVQNVPWGPPEELASLVLARINRETEGKPLLYALLLMGGTYDLTDFIDPPEDHEGPALDAGVLQRALGRLPAGEVGARVFTRFFAVSSGDAAAVLSKATDAQRTAWFGVPTLDEVLHLLKKRAQAQPERAVPRPTMSPSPPVAPRPAPPPKSGLKADKWDRLLQWTRDPEPLQRRKSFSSIQDSSRGIPADRRAAFFSRFAELLLHDPDLQVRASAAWHVRDLSAIADASNAGVLLEALRQGEAGAQGEMKEACRSSKASLAEFLDQAERERLIDELLSTIAASNGTTRGRAAHALIFMRPHVPDTRLQHYVAALVRELQLPDGLVSEPAIALGRLAPRVMEMDPDWTVDWMLEMVREGWIQGVDPAVSILVKSKARLTAEQARRIYDFSRNYNPPTSDRWREHRHAWLRRLFAEFSPLVDPPAFEAALRDFAQAYSALPFDEYTRRIQDVRPFIEGMSPLWADWFNGWTIWFGRQTTPANQVECIDLLLALAPKASPGQREATKAFIQALDASVNSAVHERASQALRSLR
jgi:hypothetical protein